MSVIETDQLLEGLDDDQRAAVISDAAPLCIIAGAGSGKTRVLTRRIAYRIATTTAEAEHVLALTFTRKAADELRTRLGLLGVPSGIAAGTFHALAYAQLRRRWADEGKRAPALLEQRHRIINEIIGPNRPAKGLPIVRSAEVIAEIDWARARLIAPAHYSRAAEDARRRPTAGTARIAELFGKYEQEKRKRGVVDFDDLLSLCADALEQDPAFASAQQWRFRTLFVDELQDVNALQIRLLKAWLGGRPDLCAVGDPRQAIYSFNGSDPGFIERFDEHFPRATVLQLTRNYRSTPEIIELAHRVLPATASLPPLVPMKPSRDWDPELQKRRNDGDEVDGVARTLRRMHSEGYAWRDCAVLARTNVQLDPLRTALAQHHIPTREDRGRRELELAGAAQFMAALKAVPGNTLLSAGVKDVADAFVEVDLDDRARERADQLSRLTQELRSLDPGATVDGFIAWLPSALRDTQLERSPDVVELTTFHRAKGLEWRAVIVVGVEAGYVPHAHARTTAAEAEERRLLYVALTRAEERLVCSWAGMRKFGERSVRRHRSPFLDLVPENVASVAPNEIDVRNHLSASRALLSKPSKGTTALHAALRSWRSSTARAANVPAYVVFNDKTLEEVADRRPTTMRSLADIAGFGPVKVSRYGEAILEMVQEHAS